MKQLNRIYINLSHRSTPVDIELNNQNLIITGSNGCGKTSLLEQLFHGLESIAGGNNSRMSRAGLMEQLRSIELALSGGPSKEFYVHYKTQKVEIETKLAELDKVNLKLHDEESLRRNNLDGMSVLCFYEAYRRSEIVVDDVKPSLLSLKLSHKDKLLTEHFGIQFEKYLVAQKQFYNDIIASEDSENKDEAKRIQGWLEKVQRDLQYLFEDVDLKLEYDREKQSFLICQKDKLPFRFDQLSSGFSAIMYIYADLLMKVELKNIASTDLEGIVLIDEIDAHLHVSLQRRIFKFFNDAFPNIQFIISTHSPFVVQSVDNVLIYDLSKNEILEDLSMYSYQSILEGLLGVTVNSLSMEELLDELEDAVILKTTDKNNLEKLIRILETNTPYISDEASILIENAKAYLDELKAFDLIKGEGKNV